MSDCGGGLIQMTECNHEFVTYKGIFEEWDYCSKCDVKYNDLQAIALKERDTQEMEWKRRCKAIEAAHEAIDPCNDPTCFARCRAHAKHDSQANVKHNQQAQDVIDITKIEFMDAVDKVYRRDDFKHSDFAELLWEEILADWNGEPDAN